MRILHAILSEGFYGSERYCIELAVEQARIGHAVGVLGLGGDTGCIRRFAVTTDGARRAGTIGAGGGSLSLMSMPHWLPAFAHRPLAHRMLWRFAPDIVHSHLNPAARRIGRTAQQLGVPHVATLHLDYDAREHGNCDGLICIARWQRERVPASFRGEVAMIRNWLPASVKDALARTMPGQIAALRASWRAAADTIVFGSVGRLMPEKAFGGLVSAFRAAFPRRDEKAALVVVGDGPERGAVQRAADGDPRVVLAGAVDEVAPRYAAFDVYVSAARFEPFGLTILEAMAAGLPLILTRTQGPQEFVTDPRVQWVGIEDDAALAAALRVAAVRRRERLTYDLAAFTAERAAREIEDFYRATLAKRRGA